MLLFIRMEEHHAIEPIEVMKDFALGSVLAGIIGFAFGWIGGYVRLRATMW